MIVSFAAVFWDVTQKTAAKETSGNEHVQNIFKTRLTVFGILHIPPRGPAPSRRQRSGVLHLLRPLPHLPGPKTRVVGREEGAWIQVKLQAFLVFLGSWPPAWVYYAGKPGKNISHATGSVSYQTMTDVRPLIYLYSHTPKRKFDLL